MIDPSESFEKALVALMLKLSGINRYAGAILEDNVRAAHASEVAAARHENPDSEWRGRMEAYGYDSPAKVMGLIAAARCDAFAEALAKFLSLMMGVGGEPLDIAEWLEDRARAGDGTKGGGS